MLKILRTEIDGCSLFSNNQLTIDFTADKNVTEEELEKNEIFRLDNLIDELNVLSFVGSNATGKTTQLKLIKMVIDVFLSLKSINAYSSLSALFTNRFSLTNYFYSNSTLFKIESFLEKKGDQTFTFIEEIITSKKIYASHKKSNLFTFDLNKRGQHELFKRSKLSLESTAFLRNDFSIFSTIVRKENSINNDDYLIDEIEMTNSNDIKIGRNLTSDYIQYLDPSIEYLKILSNEQSMKQANVEIKFINHDTIQVPMIELVNYLSSGTIKGINLFTDIEKILNSGGYLIIDEIENHLNKSIIMNVIQFFLSSLNSHGATLIFSTHYSEIIDILPRTDMVYVSTKKNNLISTNKMSILLGNADRNSRKKSEILLSGTLDHTPTYRALKLVRKRLRENQPSSFESVEVN